MKLTEILEGLWRLLCCLAEKPQKNELKHKKEPEEDRDLILEESRQYQSYDAKKCSGVDMNEAKRYI